MSRGLNALSALGEEYAECGRCTHLCASRTSVVFGAGSASADIMIIGEKPGESEDQYAIPFIGDGGRLLMQLLADVWPADERLTEILKISPEKDSEDPNYQFFEALRDYFDDYIFWTNTILCYPGDRAPATQELKNCRDRLQRAIYAVDPLLIITTGKTAASVIVGKAVGITNKAGTIFDISVPSPVTGLPVRYPMLAILDPTSLLRQGDQTLYGIKQGDTWETAQALKFGLGLLQQQYKDSYGTKFPERPASAGK